MRCASTAAGLRASDSAKAAISGSRSAAASNTPPIGGRINADFIDNSAGVNTSDVEVNLKILLDAARCRRARSRAHGAIGLLAAATDEVAELVLRNNYLQSQAISLMEQRAWTICGASAVAALARTRWRTRSSRRIPARSIEEIEQRRREGRGLTRPELALLLSYGKIALNHALSDSGSADDPYLARELERYFPQAFRRRFARRIKRHRLRRQIIITATTNSIVNRVGPALLMQCAQDGDANAVAVARAYTIARDSADLRRAVGRARGARWAHQGRPTSIEALLESSSYLRHLTRWLLRSASARLPGSRLRRSSGCSRCCANSHK